MRSPSEDRPGLAREVSARALAVAGLLAVAVTQPVLDVFGRNPPFFTSGPYDDRQIVAFALTVALVPVGLATLLLAVTAALHRRAGQVGHLAIVAAVGAVLGNVVLRTAGRDGTAWAIVAGLGVAALAVWFDRTRPGRLLLQYLAVSQALFVFSFLVLSPTSRLLDEGRWQDGLGRVEVPALSGPVVVVVLDELPVTTLLSADGSIDARRFPGFAALAERTTWFRNASSNSPNTHVAVPSLLSGRVADPDGAPSFEDHPRNLFTLLGGAVPIEQYQPVTDLCPGELCPRDDPPPLRQALEDAAVVYGHRVLPPQLRDELPEIGWTWGGFGGGLGEAAEQLPDDMEQLQMLKFHVLPREEKHPARQAQVLADSIDAVDPAEPRLHLVHVTLPHFPWALTPWGTSLPIGWPYPEPYAAATGWDAQLQHQLHVLQVGALDREITAMVDDLDANGFWERGTAVVVADHGVSLTRPDVGRTLTDTNEQELLRVPLFVGGRGVAPGAVVDEPAQVIDVVPTLVDLLDIDTDWDFDGHSLFDGSEPTSSPIVGTSFDPALEIVRGHLPAHPSSEDPWRPLLAVGPHGDLVGSRVEELSRGSASERGWRMDPDVPLPAEPGAFPHLMFGVVLGTGEPPEELLVGVDGQIAGVAGGFTRVEDGWRFSAVLGEPIADGVSELELYEVDGTGAGRELRPLR